MIRAAPILLAISFAIVGCTPQSSGGAPQPGGQTAGQRRVGPTRITIAIMGDPSGLSNTIDRAGAGGTPGLDAVEELVNAGLVQANAGGILQGGSAAVAACQTNGFTFTHTVAGGNVTAVTVGGIVAACQGGSLTLNLANSSGISIGSGTAAVPAGCSNCSVAVPVSPQPAATSVVADAIAVTGP